MKRGFVTGGVWAGGGGGETSVTTTGDSSGDAKSSGSRARLTFGGRGGVSW